MRVRNRLLISLAAIAGLLAVPAPAASAATETAASGPLTAQMSYKRAGLGWKNLRIAIVRNGATLLSQKPGRVCEFCGPVWPGGGGTPDSPSVHALQLDATPEPEAVFDLYSGCAHCCWYSLIFRYDPATSTYLGLEHHWFNAGYRFFDPEKDGIPEFLSRDDSFAYKYASYAGSLYPPQIWRYVAGRMLDVTRQYPGIVRRSARGHRRLYRRGRGDTDVRAALAAYAADK
ncbi:MAG: hypothetical protein ACRDKV_05165, partial [Solirubrobacterales bacterium]